MIEGVFGREAETVAFFAWRRLPLWKHVLGNIWWRQATSRTVPSSSPWLLRLLVASDPIQCSTATGYAYEPTGSGEEDVSTRRRPLQFDQARPGRARGGRTMHASGNGEGAERWLDHLLRLSPWPDITATTNKQWA